MTYDPTLGRRLEEDPIGFEGGDANLYRFVGNSPVDNTDPSGLRIVRIQDGWGIGKLIYVPDSYKGDIQDYIDKNHPISSEIGNRYRPVDLSPSEQALANAAKGNDAAEKELILLLNLADVTRVMPALPVLGYFFPDTFGSHCVRWTSALETPLYKLPSDKFGKNVTIRQYTLRYPRRGGPEHSVILVRIRGTDVVLGIDNGALAGKDHLFDPMKVINDPSYPQEMRDDLQKALDEFKNKK